MTIANKTKTRKRAAKAKGSDKQAKRTQTRLGKLQNLALLAVGAGVLLLGSMLFNQFGGEQTRVLGVSEQLNSQEILRLLNLERAKEGLGPLNLNARLNEAAANKGESMFAQDYWAHVAPDGTEPWEFISESGYAYESAGENLARDFYTEAALIEGWLDSPTHRENLLNGNFRETGLAVLDGEIDGQAVLLVVNLFAQPRLEAGDPGPQMAVYQNESEGLVLAGEVVAAGSELGVGGEFSFSGWQLAFGAGCLLLVSYLVYHLSLAPRGRKRVR